jgi:hypothetical protein
VVVVFSFLLFLPHDENDAPAGEELTSGNSEVDSWIFLKHYF